MVINKVFYSTCFALSDFDGGRSRSALTYRLRSTIIYYVIFVLVNRICFVGNKI